MIAEATETEGYYSQCERWEEAETSGFGNRVLIFFHLDKSPRDLNVPAPNDSHWFNLLGLLLK